MPPEQSQSDDVFDAMIQIKSRVPDSAATAGVLGTEREGLGVRIRTDGLIMTIGYLVLEASEIWLTNHMGQTSPGHLVAHDFESGISLLIPETPLGEHSLTPSPLGELDKGQTLAIINNMDGYRFPCRLLSLAEFVGRWEYLLDTAIYTLPACDDWGGAPLVDDENGLLGIGSLFLEFPSGDAKNVFGNMFVPVETIAPHIDDLCLNGRRRTAPRPWIGAFVEEQNQTLTITGLYSGGPAEKSGIVSNDTIVAIGAQPIRTISGFLRTLWSSGSAGVAVNLRIRRENKELEIVVDTIDRNSFFEQPRSGGLN